MKKNRTYKQKNRYLALGFLASLLIIYLVTFRNTIHIAGIVKKQQADLERATHASAMSAKLHSTLNELNNRIGVYAGDTSDSQAYLLTQVADFCKKERLVLRELPRYKTDHLGQIMILTNTLIVEGDFKSLLRLIHSLEQQNKSGRICSVSFGKYTDIKQKKEVLSLAIYVQKIHIKEYDEV